MRIDPGGESTAEAKSTANRAEEVDRVIHEPARLIIVAILSAVDSADFLFLLRETGLTKGNLSSHLAKLEQASYVEIEKTYQGKTPLTVCRLTDGGRKAFEVYRRQMRKLMRDESTDLR